MNKMFFSAVFALIFLSNSITVSGNSIISRTIEQDGQFFECSEIIQSPLPVKINLLDKECKGMCSVFLLNRQDIYEKITDIQNQDGCYIIDPQIFEECWDIVKLSYIHELNRDIHKIKIRFTNMNGLSDDIVLNWALVPSRPTVSNIDFTYQFNWEDNDIYPNGLFSFIVHSDYATGYMMNFSNSFLYKAPDFYPWCMSFDAVPVTKISYDADWGEYIQMEAHNTFGAVLGTPFCTTAYITDPEVLKRINELNPAKVDDVIADSSGSFINWRNNAIWFNAIADNIAIYNATGQLIGTWTKTDYVDMSDYASGVYFVVATHDSEIHKTKILKK